MHIDHICLAVRSIASASDAMCKMFGYELKTEKVTNTRQQVNVQFFCKDNSLDIKLIEPANMESPLCDFLKKKNLTPKRTNSHPHVFQGGLVEKLVYPLVQVVVIEEGFLLD